MTREPNEFVQVQRGYTAAEVDVLTTRARALLDQLRDVLAEIGERMTALTEEREPGTGTGGRGAPAG